MCLLLLSIALLYIGRKTGWALSKGVLYTGHTSAALLSSIIWGAVIAMAVWGLIRWQSPSWWLKFPFGYLLGAYVAIPNFGLINPATIPESAQPRHLMVSQVPWITYILLVILLSVMA